MAFYLLNILAWLKNRDIDESDEEPEKQEIRAGLEKHIERINKWTDPVTSLFKKLKDNTNLYDIKEQLNEKVNLSNKIIFLK